jgi:hypothetical protein
VAEVENLFLLPSVFAELAKLLKLDAPETAAKVAQLKAATFASATAHLEALGVSSAKRQLDLRFKRIGLTAKSETELVSELAGTVAQIDAAQLCTTAKTAVQAAVVAEDYEKVLALYDNKGLLAEVIRALGLASRKTLEELIGRALRSTEQTDLATALKAVLPAIAATPASRPAPASPAVPAVAAE